MPSSVVRSFTDPDEYAAAFRATRVEWTITERGQFTGELIRIDLHRLWMQRYSDNLPRVAYSATIKGRAIISFRTRPGPSQQSGGAEIHPTDIARLPEGVSSFLRSSGSASWGAMSLPMEDMDSVGAAIGGSDLTAPRDRLIVIPPAAAMAKLQRLHAAAGYLAEEAPEIIAQPEAARGLEQALIEAMVDCLTAPDDNENSLAQAQHAIVMHRFRRVVGENPEHPLYIPEICKAIGVSSRTLQACCHEHLGMGPKHYLLLRRMHLARRALRQAGPDTTVTEIATRYGFWQLGRFAVEYQSLFDESPSATLGQPPE